jgi:hypothetical protein
MDRHVFGSFKVDLPQKLSEFDITMPRITRTDDLPLQHVPQFDSIDVVSLVVLSFKP